MWQNSILSDILSRQTYSLLDCQIKAVKVLSDQILARLVLIGQILVKKLRSVLMLLLLFMIFYAIALFAFDSSSF